MTVARDLRLNIQGDSSSADKAFASATAALEKTQKELKSTEARTDALAIKARKLAEAEERAADKTRDLAEKTAVLRKQLEESGDATGTLGKKLDRLSRDAKTAALATDDYRRAADRAAENAREQARAYDKVADNARQAARAVALLSAANALPGNGGGRRGGILGLLGSLGSSGLSLGSKAVGAAGNALAGLGESAAGLAGGGPGGAIAVGVGVPTAVAAGTFIGAAAGGGALAGLGAAGAGLGLAGAWANDPEKYAAAWGSATDKIKKRWLDSSAAFGNELDGVLKVADRTLQNLPVEKVLALSQSFVAPLAEGAGQGVGGIASGFADALERVQPVVDKLGPAIGNLGHDIGDAFRIISQGSEGGADALSDFVGAVGFVVKATATLILGFENAYESMRGFVIGANEVATTMPGVGVAILGAESYLFHIGSTSTQTARKLDSAGKSAHSTASGWGEMGKAAAAAAIQTIGLNDALTELRNTQLAQANANLAVAQGWLDLADGLKEGAKSLDLSTQAGVDNQKVIIAQAQALEQQREQTIKLGHETPEAIAAADAAYDAGIQKIRDMAHAAHFTDAQVDDLLRSYGLLPPVVTTQVKTPGLDSALGQGISLGNALNNIDGRTYYAHVDLSYTSHLPSGISLGSLLHHARGGEMPYSGFHVTGEHGAEVTFASRGAYTATAEETRKLAQMAGSSSAGGAPSSSVGLMVMPGADPYVGSLVQQLIDRGFIQAFAGGQPVTARRG